MKRIFMQILMTTMLFSFFAFWHPTAYASNDFSWEKNIDEVTVNLSSVTYGNGLFIAVGEDGMIKSSPDGFAWTCRRSGIKEDLWNVSWCKDRFFALGSSGLILSSADGINWAKQKPPTKYGLSDAIWDGKQFMIVGGWGTILTSPDGLNWKEQSPITDESYIAISYSNGKYVIAASKAIIGSENGLDWTIQEYPEMYRFYDVASNGSVFTLTGWRYSGEDEFSCIFTSKDGVEWERNEFVSDDTLNGITCNGTAFLCAGTGTLASSSDGTIWTLSKNNNLTLQSVVFANNKYIGVGISGEIYVSDDGENWQYAGLPNNIDFYDAIWANNSFIGVGGNESDKIMTSIDGKTWSSRHSQGFLLNAITYDGSKYVAVGVNGSVMTSTDEIHWEAAVIGGNPCLMDVEWNGSLFVATGDKGEIYTSTDAETWTRMVTRTDNSLNGIVWTGKKFVVVGGTSYKRIILNSSDGINWSTVSNSDEFYTDLRGVILANNQYVAYGSHGYITVSKDGTNWTPVQSKASVGINDVVWTGSKYYYIGDFGLMGSSVDGVNWKLEDSGTTVTLKTICWNGEKLIAAGYKNIILKADPMDMIKVKVNNAPVCFDVAPIIKDGRTLVPLRGIFEALGAEINWNDQTKAVIATRDGLNMILKVGSKEASVNGKKVTLEVPAVNYNGRVLVPTRFIAESFGAIVTWDSDARMVVVTTN